MKILSHRGYWKEEKEKNTIDAVRKAFDHGFGIESDIRDLDGKLVISHNPADRKPPARLPCHLPPYGTSKWRFRPVCRP